MGKTWSVKVGKHFLDEEHVGKKRDGKYLNSKLFLFILLYKEMIWIHNYLNIEVLELRNVPERCTMYRTEKMYRESF
jgi:hypothetical protein